jgi:multicomponent Na+:H+ antiporter subunit F
MAAMTSVWLTVAICLVPPLMAMIAAAARLSVPQRFLAFELMTSLTILMLMVLSFAFDQPSSIDLALTAALLSLPGTVLFALFEERWL